MSWPFRNRKDSYGRRTRTDSAHAGGRPPILPRVEYYSIDEFFFEAVPHRGLSLQATAEAMRDHILEVVGVPVTVGVARTRTLAKLISDTAKPFGASAVLGSV